MKAELLGTSQHLTFERFYDWAQGNLDRRQSHVRLECPHASVLPLRLPAKFGSRPRILGTVPLPDSRGELLPRCVGLLGPSCLRLTCCQITACES